MVAKAEGEGEGESEDGAPETLDAIVEHRAAFLREYQDEAWAERYRRLVERVRAAEAERTPGRSGLAEAVARNLFRLMSYKDEYEVARLYTSGEFEAGLRRQFEGDFRLRFPSPRPSSHGATPRPESFESASTGAGCSGAFRVLARMRRLRGTRLDLFGRTAERRMERRLIEEYRETVGEILDRLAPANHEAAVALASVPEGIKGFGHVKERSVEAARRRAAQLEAELRAAAADPTPAPAPVHAAGGRRRGRLSSRERLAGNVEEKRNSGKEARDRRDGGGRRLHGGHLARTGQDVTFLDPWPAHVEYMKARGIELFGVTEAERFTVPVRALHLSELESLAREAPFDIAFVCTKSYDTAWSTTMIAPFLAPDGFVVSLQNCINEETIAGIVGWGRTVGCIASVISVELFKPGHVRRAVPLGGERHTVFRIGEPHGPADRTRRGSGGDAPGGGQRQGHHQPVGRALVQAHRELHAERGSRPPPGSRAGKGTSATTAAASRSGSRRRARRWGRALGYDLEVIYGFEPDLLVAAAEGSNEALDTLESDLLDRAPQREGWGRGAPPLDGAGRDEGPADGDRLAERLRGAARAEIGMSAPANRAITEVVKRVERREAAPHPDLVSGI